MFNQNFSVVVMFVAFLMAFDSKKGLMKASLKKALEKKKVKLEYQTNLYGKQVTHFTITYGLFANIMMREDIYRQ